MGVNPRRFIISPKNGGDLCAHRAGGASTYRFVCALAQSIFFELPLSVNEATEFRTTTKRREEAPRLAVRTEKRANKNVKIRLLF